MNPPALQPRDPMQAHQERNPKPDTDLTQPSAFRDNPHHTPTPSQPQINGCFRTWTNTTRISKAGVARSRRLRGTWGIPLPSKESPAGHIFLHQVNRKPTLSPRGLCHCGSQQLRQRSKGALSNYQNFSSFFNKVQDTGRCKKDEAPSDKWQPIAPTLRKQ